MMGTVSDSFFEDCAVQHSFFRAYTVHGTSFSRVSRNVAYDVSGSAYYLEDGNEVGFSWFWTLEIILISPKKRRKLEILLK